MVRYIYYHNYIIVIDGNTINDIIDPHTYKSRDRLKLKDILFLKNKSLPDKIKNDYDIHRYDSIDALKKANNIHKEKINYNGTGEYKSYYRNGNLKEEYFCANHKKEGIYRKYFPDNTIQIECYYVNDLLHGSYKEYKEYRNQNKSDEDRLIKICQYDMNKLSGKCINYLSVDKKYYEEYTYVDNVKNGEYKILNYDGFTSGVYENGYIIENLKLDKYNNIISKENKIDDDHVLVTNYKNNKILEVYEKNIKTNRKNGICKTYYEYGNYGIKIESNHKDGYTYGIYKEYYVDGTIRKKCEYQNYRLVNDYFEYHPNGNIYIIINFQNNIEKIKKVYDINGKLTEYCLKDNKDKYLLQFGLYTSDKNILDDLMKELDKN
jgi:antitoxin component YwqK of YwqJK toxin-antitoxin module